MQVLAFKSPQLIQPDQLQRLRQKICGRSLQDMLEICKNKYACLKRYKKSVRTHSQNYQEKLAWAEVIKSWRVHLRQLHKKVKN